MKYLPSKPLLILVVLGVALGGGTLVFWATKKPAATFERGNTSWENTLPGSINSAKGDNVTVKTAQGLLSEYLAVQEGSETLTPEERARVAEDVAEKVRQESTREQPFVLGDLHLVGDSPATYRTYGNEMGMIFSRYEKNGLENEIAIMKRAFSQKSTSELSKITVNADAYSALANDLVKVSVPKSLADIHLRFSNGYSGVASALTDITLVFEDSLRGMIGIKSYDEHLRDVVAATSDLRTFFSKNQIIFGETEPGFPLARVRP